MAMAATAAAPAMAVPAPAAARDATRLESAVKRSGRQGIMRSLSFH